MKLFHVALAVGLMAAATFADSGVLAPGQDVRIGNLHIANLEGAGGNVNYNDNGITVALLVHDDAFCAVVKNGDRVQARRVASLVLGGGYYAQANVKGARIVVLGDNAAALALALRRSDTNNANTISLLGNGNIAAAARWCYGRGEVLMNRIEFGQGGLFTASNNKAYLSGDRQGTADLAWANRSVDIAGTNNRTIAWDGFDCTPPTDDDDGPVVDIKPTDIATGIDAEARARDTKTVAVAVR